MSGTVTVLSRYPVKSVGGETIEQAIIDDQGVLGDRCFAFLDLESGAPCNAKNPRKYGALLRCTAFYASEPEAGQPLPAVHVRFPDGTTAEQGVDLDQRMSEFLGRPVALISDVPDQLITELAWEPETGLDREGVYALARETPEGDQLITLKGAHHSARFVDLAPLHLITTSTLRHFEQVDPTVRFDHRRYRPSFVLDTPGAGLVEDGWMGGTLNSATGLALEVAMPTPRCVMSTLEHAEDVPLDRRTLRTIAQHNTVTLPDMGRGACLGVYAEVVQPGRIRVGDVLQFRPGASSAPRSPLDLTRRSARRRGRPT